MIKLYITEFGKITPLEDILEEMTDDWIDNGECTDQRIIDLRDCCKLLIKQLEEK